MKLIARNAICAAIAITLWPHILFAQPLLGQSLPECPPLFSPPFTTAAFVSAADTTSEPQPQAQPNMQSGVRFEMRPGRLKPQLERVLREHLGVQHIVWQAAEEHAWPSAYELHASSWPALVESLLEPYQLRMQLFVNHSAVISDRYQGGGGYAH